MKLIHTETMSAQFQKLHMTVGKFPLTLHHFTGPDKDGPHDHPFAFTTNILAGGYVEQVWKRRKGYWQPYVIARPAGTSHLVEADCIHRIIELPEGECITSVVWHDQAVDRRETCFYELREGVMWKRQWNENEFVRYL